VDRRLLDEDELVVRHALDRDLGRVAQVGGVKGLLLVQNRPNLGNAAEVLLAATADGHDAALHKDLLAQIVDRLGGHHHVGAGVEDLVDALRRDLDFLLADLLQLVRVWPGGRWGGGGRGRGVSKDMCGPTKIYGGQEADK